MNADIHLEHRAGSSQDKHEGEPSLGLCDRLDRTRDNSQRQLPTDHDYAVPTREYQTDQSSLKTAPTAARSVFGKRKRKPPKQTHRSRPVDTVTPYQAKYLAAATPVLKDVATLMLETGMRPEEVYRIKPENVNLAGGFLLNPFGKTKAARRRVPLTLAARNLLARRMKGLETPFLFPCDTDSKRPVPKVNNAHDRTVKNSKVTPFRLYDLRHTWATRAAESGIDLVTLAALLGHSKIQMVLRYAHPSQEHQARSVERMEQFVAARQLEELMARQETAQVMIQ